MKKAGLQNTFVINELALDVRNNGTEAFVELLGFFSPIITSIALSFSLPRSEFDDLCQEGRIALYRAAMTYDGKTASFKTYASKCIRNSMSTWAQRCFDDVAQELDSKTEETVADLTSEVPEQVFSNDVVENILDGKLQGLSDYERKCIALRIVGNSVKEIALLVKKSEKSVENTLFRARNKLKKYIVG